MSPRYGPSSRAIFRLQSNAIAPRHDLHDLHDRFMRSDLRIGSKVPYHASTSLQNFGRAPSQPHREKSNMANKTFKQNGVRSQDLLKDASKRPSSDIVHINTRDILTIDWRRRAVEQAVQNARHLIQAYEEEIAESERRVAELYSGANGINQDCRVEGCCKEGHRTTSGRPAGGGGRQECLTKEMTRAAWELSSVGP
jgi:hypothetical protein